MTMKVSTIIGSAFILGGLVVIALVVSGKAEPVTLVALGVCALGAIISFVVGRLFGGMNKQGALISTLPDVGVRRKGRVRDALPASTVAGTPFANGTAHMILQVDLEEDEDRPADTVQLHVLESSEAARARIGRDVIVLEHPDAPGIRALDGFTPMGSKLYR